MTTNIENVIQELKAVDFTKNAVGLSYSKWDDFLKRSEGKEFPFELTIRITDLFGNNEATIHHIANLESEEDCLSVIKEFQKALKKEIGFRLVKGKNLKCVQGYPTWIKPKSLMVTH